MRPFSSRLGGPAAQTLLPVLCVAIQLACATSFPVENLEEGMTAKTVLENFGEPKAIETNSLASARSSWPYVDQEQHWQMFIFPQFLLSIPICALLPDVPWDYLYVLEGSVVLDFEAKKLVSWEVIEPVPSVSSGTDHTFQDPFPSKMTFPRKAPRPPAKRHKH